MSHDWCVPPVHTTHEIGAKFAPPRRMSRVDRASRADARERADARTRRVVEDIRRARSLVVGDASARPREDREARTGKGTIPTFPRRRHDDDRDLRDDERAIDDAGGGGERTNEIVRAVWRRREG